MFAFARHLKVSGRAHVQNPAAVSARTPNHRLAFAVAAKWTEVAVPARGGWRRMYSAPASEGASLLELVKQLRKETQAGISDCREALLESEKDIEKAKVWLLKKARKVAAKKGTRSAFEGGILATAAPNAVLLEMNCETDFAAKETNFTSVLRDIAKTLQDHPSSDVEEILRFPHSSPTVGGVAVTDTHQAIETLTGILKENVKLRRACTLTPQPDVINFSYVHGSLDSNSPPIGRIGVLLSLKLTPFPEKIVKSLNTMANNFCVQIAVNNPQALYPDPSQTFTKSEDQETEPVFTDQEYLFDSSVTVAKEIHKFQKKMGYTVQLVHFKRWELAEGLERTEANLANDVQALLKESASKPS